MYFFEQFIKIYTSIIKTFLYNGFKSLRDNDYYILYRKSYGSNAELRTMIQERDDQIVY